MHYFFIFTQRLLSHHIFVLLLFCFSVQTMSAQKINRIYATRTDTPPAIDGLLTDKTWTKAKAVMGFEEFFPDPGEAAEQQTEVRILYDDKAIYIAAIMYEADISRIGKELSVRDDNTVKSDIFEVYLDPYNAGQNAWSYGVTAAGVQLDAAINPENEALALGRVKQTRVAVTALDEYMSAGRANERNYVGVTNDILGDPLTESGGVAWDAVWQSEVKTYKNAWAVEMKIPYSAIRFPDKDVQTWGINFKRTSWKSNEISFWNPVDPKREGFVSQFGRLHGLRKIKPPTRLSFTPYVMTRSNYTPTDNREDSPWSSEIAGGMDMRVGINETTTLDLSLIPDFGQVPFDDVVLNLGPFEQRFDENRPFFTEGFELFERAGVFYSRRVGGQPVYYKNVLEDAAKEPDDREILEPTSDLIKNPIKAQLINATKLTTRNRKGLGLGFFNAITAPSSAETQTGTGGGIIRVIPTGPATNYNVIVIDQLLANNSHVSFINTNVIRGGSARDSIVSDLTNGGYRDANVTAMEYALFDKNNDYGVIGRGAISQLFLRDANDNPRGQGGFAYSVKAGKFGGNLRYSVERDLESRTYDANDLGFSTQNRIFHRGRVEYKIFDAFMGFYDFNVYAGINHEQRFVPNDFANYFLEGGFWWTFSNDISAGVFGEYFPRPSNDYFEPRQEGRLFVIPKNYELNTFLATDLTRAISYQFDFAYRAYPEWEGHATKYGGLARLRFGRGLNIQGEIDYEQRKNDRGFVDNDSDGTIVIGQRDRRDITGAVTANILFNDRMSITARARHFWALVEYQEYFQLRQDGTLRSTVYEEDNNTNFNAYNIDLIYRFRFAPGSEFNIIWKRSLLNENAPFTYNYIDNWNEMSKDQTPDNLFSVKLLYYLDYSNMQRRRRE